MKMNHEEDYVGVIDMYDKTKTFGFLVSSIVERSTGRSKIQSFYFNYLCWDDATTYPTEGHYVVFVGCESRNGFRAKKVLPVSFNLNKAVGITRRVRVGQFQLPYVLPAA